jgi:pilus assembly protein CpaB
VSFTDPDTTALTLRDVLVTGIQGGVDVAEHGDADVSKAPNGSEPLPGTSVMVTLAVTPAQAQKVVFGADHGTLWLTLEPARPLAAS